ncbi:MAG: permease-like cell division protein FtsX [Mogibacterium sp.]|nr:permease-like cell division protein FtsX [Mogibacterium sp.]
MFSRIGYTIRQTFSQLFRNKAMGFTAVVAITAMMLVLGIFFVAFVNVDLFAKVIQEDYNVVEVYMADGQDDASRERVGNELEALDGVSGTEFRSRDQALEIMKERWGENAYLLENLKRNPLPDSWLVYVEDKDAASYVASTAVSIEGVDDVRYYQDTIEKLAKITDFIRIASITVMAFLILVSVIIVANTIKLTVMNREKEISIMKYLGATDWFVRAPFLLEGILIGAFSAVVATGLIYLVYGKVIDIIGTDVMRVLSVPVVSQEYLIPNLLIIFISLGVGIGTCGSIISVRRFLDR